MSRYSNINPLAAEVYARIQPHSSLRPIAQSAILGAFNRTTLPDAVHDALEQLIDARLISHMRHTLNGVTQNVYWPTGLKPITAPSIEEIRMASESQNSTLAKLILMHGPLTSTDLAAKAQAKGLNCPKKNVPGILGGHLTRGEVISKKHDGAVWYMTPNQAADWDENLRIGAQMEADSAAHVMSAPPETKQSGGEIPVNKASTESDELAEARRTIQSLHDSIDGMLSDWTDIRQALDVSTHEEALQAIAQLSDIAERAGNSEASLNKALAYNRIAGDLLADLEELLDVEHRDELLPRIRNLLIPVQVNVQAGGRLALLLIDSADLTEIEELDKYDAANAQQLAVRSVEQGTAARAVVVRILGEAQRRVEWREAA